MEVRLSVKLTTKEMFDFMMKHTYSSFSGYLGLIISACALIGFGMSFTSDSINVEYKIVLLITAALFLVVQPLNLYFRSKKQVQMSEAVNKPMEYVFDNNQIRVSQGEEYVEYEWGQVYKVSSTKTSILLYTGKMRAFVLPRSSFKEGDLANLKELVKTKATSARSMNFGKVA